MVGEGRRSHLRWWSEGCGDPGNGSQGPACVRRWTTNVPGEAQSIGKIHRIQLRPRDPAAICSLKKGVASSLEAGWKLEPMKR